MQIVFLASCVSEINLLNHIVNKGLRSYIYIISPWRQLILVTKNAKRAKIVIIAGLPDFELGNIEEVI